MFKKIKVKKGSYFLVIVRNIITDEEEIDFKTPREMSNINSYRTKDCFFKKFRNKKNALEFLKNNKIDLENIELI